MATALQNFKAALKARWQALTPSVDGSGAAYDFVDTLDEERGLGAHRELCFRLARRSDVATLVGQDAWDLPVEVYIHRNDRVAEDWRAAAENETHDLERDFDQLVDCGANVISAELIDTEFEENTPQERGARGGLSAFGEVITATFNFSVLCGES